jgi:hypothetical protein
MLPGVIAKYRATPPPTWTPASLPGLYAWFQADNLLNSTAGTTMFSMKDLSGNGHDATFSTSVTLVTGGLGGHAYFSSSSGGTTFGEVGTSTGFLNNKPAGNYGVMTVPTYTGNNIGSLIASETPSSTFARCNLRYPDQTAQRFSLLGRRLDADTLQRVPSPSNNTGASAIVACADYASANAELRVNGTSLVSTTFQTAGNTSATNANRNTYLNAESGGNGYGGMNYEYVLGNASWSLSDRQKLEGYLCWRYGQQSLLPVGHPYKSAPP